uniref:Mid2 domain-containing protein n=1 Tax=Psilocybe cubensis TaxID=181762 RepID=A0A8H7YAK2_PSICU
MLHGLSLSTSLVSVANATSASVDITTDSTPSVVLITSTNQASPSTSTSAHSLPVTENSTSIALASEITSISTTQALAVTTTTSISSSTFSSVVITVESSSKVPKSSSAFSTGSSKSLAKSTVPILASTAASSSISTPSAVASKTSPKSTVPTVISGSSGGIIDSTSSMSAAAALPSIPITPNSSKNNSPVVTLADQTPTMSNSKPGATVSSHSSSPAVSTKEAAPPPASSTRSEPLPAPPSKPVEPSSSTSSKSSTTIPTPTTSHSVGTTTSVVVVKAPLNQSTSTVTQTADTTLSSAVILTSTQSNGSKVVTTPALVTLMSTSTESDGALTTVTHIVANPPNLGNTQQLSSDNGPLHKQGVLAGICVVVGIVAATAAIGLIFCIRRQRRVNRRKRWLAGMQHQRPASLATDPFRDPQESYQGPAMRSVGSTRDRNWDQGSGGSPLLSQEPMSHEQRNIFGGLSLIPDPYPAAHSINPHNQAHYEYPHAGIAYTTDMANPIAPFKRHSLTPSSPSIYPATLPPDDNERPEAGDPNLEPVQKELISPVSLSTVPPRPPRSHLRESAKFGHYAAPLTPPESNSSHNSQPSSPVADTNRPQDFFTRRTLLDVRNR